MKRDCVWEGVRGRWRCYMFRNLYVFVHQVSSASWHPDNIRAHLRWPHILSSGGQNNQYLSVRVCPLVWWSCVSVHDRIPIGLVCVSVCLLVISTETHTANLLQSIPFIFKEGESISLSVDQFSTQGPDLIHYHLEERDIGRRRNVEEKLSV